MTALGDNAHIFAQPGRRGDLRRCYFMAPGGQVFTIAPER